MNDPRKDVWATSGVIVSARISANTAGRCDYDQDAGDLEPRYAYYSPADLGLQPYGLQLALGIRPASESLESQ